MTTSSNELICAGLKTALDKFDGACTAVAHDNTDRAGAMLLSGVGLVIKWLREWENTGLVDMTYVVTELQKD